jgi:hypothetical protein
MLGTASHPSGAALVFSGHLDRTGSTRSLTIAYSTVVKNVHQLYFEYKQTGPSTLIPVSSYLPHMHTEELHVLTLYVLTL